MSNPPTHRTKRPRHGRCTVLAAAAAALTLAGCGSSRPEPAEPPGPSDAAAVTAAATPEWQNRLDALVHARSASGSGLAAGAGSYRVGPGDQLDVQVFLAPQLSAQTRVGSTGEISLPLLGQVPAQGRTPDELAREIEERLASTYMRDPTVRVEVLEMRSSGVSVVGAVNTPGVYQVTTDARLLDVLAMAEGLSETAGGTVLIARGGRGTPGFDPQAGSAAAPIDSVITQASSAATSASLPMVEEVNLRNLLASGDERLNPPVYPGDVVNVRPGGVVYVMGQVNAPGGFPLTGTDNISVLQAIALAEGLSSTAKAGGSMIIRDDGQGQKIEIPVNLGEVMDGDAAPPMLRADDVLFVPNNTFKAVAKGAWESIIRVFTFRAFF